MSIQRATRTSTLALLAALVAVLATACIPTPPATEFTGQLLDADGAVVSGAVVFVADDAGSASARVGRSHFHIDETSGCQTPSEAYLVQTCTDAEGGFTIALPSPAPSSVRLVFERSYWRTVLVVEPLVQGGRVTVTPTLPALEPDDELEAAVRFALPTLEDFELIFLNDEKAILDLIAHAGTPDANVEPIHLLLPIRQPDGTVSQPFIQWTAYHHDQRALGVLDCAIDPVTLADVDCQEVPGPSLTFQGMPWLEAQELFDLFIGETEKNLEDETVHQMSVISVVGDELDATYYGQALEAPHTPSSLQGLRSVLDVHYDPVTVDRLLAGASANYLLHNQVDLRFPVGDDDHEYESAGAVSAAVRHDVRTSDHFLEDGIKYLRPVMIADSTVYDAVEGVRLVPNYFARVDAMANRQDLFLAWAQLSAEEAPSNLTSLDQFSNAFAVRTRVGGYRRFTVSGQEGFSFPTSRCGPAGSGSLMDAYAERSRDSTTYDNEYWMWWTNTDRYPGGWGCAGGFGTLHETPRNGAVAWTSFRNYTLETVGQTFMHEAGHLLNAVHSAAATSVRCRVLGIFAFGVTGPSLMGGTSDRNLRANCFAPTLETATSLRNRTRVAEYLHDAVD
jgi:hypothetical protein